MTIVVGFKSGGHDPSMAISVDGVIVAAAEEERFTRKKHSHGDLPVNAVRWGLKKAQISPDSVDLWVVHHAKPIEVVARTIWPYIKLPPKNYAELRHAAIQIRDVYRFWVLYRREGLLPYQRLFQNLGLKNPKVMFLEHHIAHNLSGSMFCGFDRGLAISMDGKGDGSSLMVSKFHNSQRLLGQKKRPNLFQDGKFRVLKRFDPRYSLGLAFTGFTKYLGFEPNDAEYKVMGLASYGKPNIDVAPVFGYKKSGRPTRKVAPYVYNWRRSRHFQDYFLNHERQPESQIEEFHKNIAASAQKELERSALAFVNRYLQKSGESNLVLSGGVCLNVKVNMVIREQSPNLENFFVQPVSSDAGLALGCAAFGFYNQTGRIPSPIKSLHLGPHIDDFDLDQNFVASFDCEEFTDLNKLIKVVAREIASGSVIGWMQGNMELGPRSLGARSILADPRKVENRDRVNEKIKFRELFRPFCPSMLKSEFLKYVQEDSNWEISKSLPFMIEAFRVNQLAAEEIPAVVHVDNTIRPQVLDGSFSIESEKPFLLLLQEFKNITGIGVLLNTSLNRRGEPIACSPVDGLKILEATELDFMVVGTKIFRKKLGRSTA